MHRAYARPVVVLAAVALAAFAPAAAAGEARTYIGPVAGGPESARIALVVDKEEATAYVCSADDAFNQSFARWFTGTAADGLVSLDADGVKLVARSDGGAIEGRLTREGEESMKFKAEAVPAESAAGLYRAETDDGEMACGWIVDQDGNAVGALKAIGKAAKKVARKAVTLAAQRVADKVNKVADTVGTVAKVVGKVAQGVDKARDRVNGVAEKLAAGAQPQVRAAGRTLKPAARVERPGPRGFGGARGSNAPGVRAAPKQAP